MKHTYMPDPVAAPDKYEEAVHTKIQEYVSRTRGRAFVLFTSHGMLEKAARTLRRWFGEVRPAATMLSAGLADPRMKIEIEVTARHPSSPS